MSDKLLSYIKLSDEQLSQVKKAAPSYEIIEALSETDDISEVKAIYGWDKDETVQLLKDPENELKWVQLMSAGVDYVDLKRLSELGITLTNASGIHGKGITESIFGMILNHTRKIGHSLIKQRQRKWDPASNLLELSGKTMLIVGSGAIGTQTGKVAQAFGMKTIGVNRSGNPVDFMDELVTQDKLDDVLPEADFVINILPLTEETEDLFDLGKFRAMKSSAIFVNVGRGQTVVTKDLLKALDEKWIQYAALDVIHEEPLPENHPIYKREDVLLTPHIAGGLEDYAASVFPIFMENLKTFVEGDAPSKNVVDYEAGY
ncbi:Phosphoglycerate dehydrogenase [Alkalibacterium putridalgicola]|uniref:2-hydroxyacid dehydrogenase n=1 Tax=Alkalibacterium putridalgicola TaxID=426703 RepID=A0A1H7R2E2_9LACT|nr:NAD(P)-dependent oxidoreductase [Alkalibacterium putridalgicola]GEK89036.1 2-hydroxyacid dehydrogenase [Alkalibacterium putridalgicola]SEL54342.1 Phosphoglycerate dehydrogenase [Alkalibacterium putridalgicola]